MVETSMSLKATRRRSAMRRCLDFVVAAAAAGGGCVVEDRPFD